MTVPIALPAAVVRRPALLARLLALALCVAPAGAAAQAGDSTRAATPPTVRAVPVQRDSSRLQPPVSPRRAFLQSLALPGLGQASLGRPKARALFGIVEATSIFMAVKSAHDLAEAKSAPDSIPVRFVFSAPVYFGDPLGGTLTPVNARNPIADRVRSRRTFVEDWIALLVFNHLIAGADAYVAAHLWDLPAQVSASRAGPGGGPMVTVRWSW